MTFSVTPAAAKNARNRVEGSGEKGALGLRIGVRGGGCSGYYYVYDVAKEIDEERDIIVDVDGFAIVADRKSARFLEGATLDWETNLMSHGFVWKNPNAVGDCGCGSSFHVDESFWDDARQTAG